MTLKKKLVIAVAIVLLVAFTAGFTAVATSTYGSKSDPLVAKSYLDETVTPSILSELQTMIDEKAESLTESLEDLLGTTSSSGSTTVSEFTVVTLTTGQRLICEAGTELMLRVGSAESYGPDSPRLVDETDGTTVTSAGTSLTKNHMYMVTIINNGVTATSATTKILVRGSYVIS